MKSLYMMGMEDGIDQTDIIGEEPHVPAAEMPEYKPLLKLSPLPTNEQGIRLMEQAYGVNEKSEALNKSKSLGKDKELSNLADRIAKRADDLRALDHAAKMSTPSWTATRDLFFNTLDIYAGVNEGAVYKDSLLSKLVEDIGKNIESLPERAGRIVKEGIGSLKWIGIGAAGLLGLFVLGRAISK